MAVEIEHSHYQPIEHSHYQPIEHSHYQPIEHSHYQQITNSYFHFLVITDRATSQAKRRFVDKKSFLARAARTSPVKCPAHRCDHQYGRLSYRSGIHYILFRLAALLQCHYHNLWNSLRSIWVPPTHQRLCLPNGLRSLGFSTKTCHNLSSSPYVPHAQSISSLFIQFNDPNNSAIHLDGYFNFIE